MNTIFSFLQIRCLPSQYLILVNYPIKRLYTIGSVILFITGMFIYRSSHNQQEILKKSCKKNMKSSLFDDGFIGLTSRYWSLCRHPYYLGIFNEYINLELVYCIFLGNLLMLLSWSLPCGSISISWMLPTYYLFIICHKNHSEDLVSH